MFWMFAAYHKSSLSADSVEGTLYCHTLEYNNAELTKSRAPSGAAAVRTAASARNAAGAAAEAEPAAAASLVCSAESGSAAGDKLRFSIGAMSVLPLFVEQLRVLLEQDGFVCVCDSLRDGANHPLFVPPVRKYK